MRNVENKIKKTNEQINKINELDKKIQNELSIKVPQYILDEIIVGGTKENIIALTNLAKLNNRISEQTANTFIKNIDNIYNMSWWQLLFKKGFQKMRFCDKIKDENCRIYKV